ncbi:MAG: hypothetical protein IPK81_24070 [Rhodospirillales bacterium]|nr:MAG: hypothetical protein IPK81_24070 [Rhodospirillales bacterium]
MPASFKHAVDRLSAGQKTLTTCWLASYKMILKFHGQRTDNIQARMQSAGIDAADAEANGLLDTDYDKAGRALGNDRFAGTKFNKEQGFFDVGLSDGCEAFLKILAAAPLWTSRRAGKEFHIVVAVGWDDDNEQIIFLNPFPGPDHALEVKLKGNLFVRNITSAAGSVQSAVIVP